MVFKNSRSFLSLIKDFHTEKQWTDVTIQYKGGSVTCHKFILGTASPILHDYLAKSNTECDTETLVLDGYFEQAEVEQLLSYVYGVSDKIPPSFMYLFSTHLQVKPDIKPEPDEPNHVTDNDVIGLWTEDDWNDDKPGSKYKYSKYDDDDDFIDDSGQYSDECDSDYVKPVRKPKIKNKVIKTENGLKKYECMYCKELVNKESLKITEFIKTLAMVSHFCY